MKDLDKLNIFLLNRDQFFKQADKGNVMKYAITHFHKKNDKKCHTHKRDRGLNISHFSTYFMDEYQNDK